MQTSKMNVMKGWLLALILASVPALQAETVRFEAQPGSKLKVDGTSNIHDWTVESAIISGYIEIDSAFGKDSFKPQAGMKFTPKVAVMIPVRTIKSDTRRMDEVMHEHMKMKQHPRIQYELTEMTLKSVPSAITGPYEFNTKGELTVAGVKKTIEMPVTLERLDGDRLKIVGQTKLKMTDFGINPPAPSLAFGLVKTGDEVTVSFEWITAQSKKTAAR